MYCVKCFSYHVILPITKLDGFHHPHATEGETEDGSSCTGHSASKWSESRTTRHPHPSTPAHHQLLAFSSNVQNVYMGAHRHPIEPQALECHSNCNPLPWLLQGRHHVQSLPPGTQAWGKWLSTALGSISKPFPSSEPPIHWIVQLLRIQTEMMNAYRALAHLHASKEGGSHTSCLPWLQTHENWAHRGKINLCIAFPGNACFLKTGSRLAYTDHCIYWSPSWWPWKLTGAISQQNPLSFLWTDQRGMELCCEGTEFSGLCLESHHSGFLQRRSSTISWIFMGPLWKPKCPWKERRLGQMGLVPPNSF